ncbi:MAG TPA: glutamine amidotransferase [Candidatus Solibacter sp.]|nr:glutamine amidotransferase [Candidatus Solibacter sp.]
MFEILFKYPASLFHKGQFVLLTPWPVWVLVIGILAAAAAMFWHVRRNHGMLTGARPIAIWLLESCLLALILFLLWHPALSIATLRPQQNVVAVLIDDSRSMSIKDASGTREAAAQSVLNSGMLKTLSDRFQVRVYKFGKEPERIQKVEQVTGNEPASRIGDTLEQVLAESSSLPLGAIVMLTDGADNAGGIDLKTIAAIPRQRIPIHTIGFGKEHSDKDIEIADAVVPARALPDSKLTAHIMLQGWGVSGQKTKLTVKDGAKVLASQDVVFKENGALQTEAVVFNCGPAGPKTLEFAVDPINGEENQLNNKITRMVNVEARKPRILYVQGEPAWEYKFIRRAIEDYPDIGIEIPSMERTTENKILRQGIRDSSELEDGFPAKPEDLFTYQAMIFGSVEASYFTPSQQQAIHDFVDRRGGGVLFIGGRASFSDGGWQNSPMADLIPVQLPPNRGTFHQQQFSKPILTQAGAQSVLCRLDENPATNATKWDKIPAINNYQDVGEPKPGATMLLQVKTPAGRTQPLLVTENYGRGRTAAFATEGSWRWKMWLDHNDKTHATFWQQMFRHLVTDTPGQVAVTTPKSVLSDDTKISVRVEVRDKLYRPVTNAKVQARFMGPEGTSATLELMPLPLEEGIYTGEWSADKQGSYVTEIIAGREQEEIGRDVVTFRREDGVAENFHTGQNRELLEKLSEQTGGRYYKPDQASKLANEISYSEAGITSRETRDLWDMPVVFLLALGIRASEWLLRRKWGVV